jgi:diguanylate cyclase (GGDEF)-like protein
MTAMRWLIVVAYVVLAATGVLDVSTRALWLSAGPLIAYHVFYTWTRLLRGDNNPRLLPAFWCADATMVSITLVALHDIRNPVFCIYFLSITAIAQLVTRRQMFAYVVWVSLNYTAAAFVIASLDYDVAWPYAIVVTFVLQVMGVNAALLAGGQERLRNVLASVAVTDSLTGLPNRRHFHRAYPQTLNEAVVHRTPLALMLIDVDHFKEINDRHGHPAGDDKLRDVAAALQDVVRRNDMVARYGGDEFIVIAPDTPRESALALAERLRRAAASCGASVSIGVAIFPEDAQREDALVDAADAALYRAKQDGRNCVRTAVAA